MKLVRCENGHFYDSEQYTVCPYCSGMDSVGADNVTQPISQKKPDDDIPTQKESNAKNKLYIKSCTDIYKFSVDADFIVHFFV